MHIESIKDARPVLKDLWRSGKTIGSIHTLGALHEGHTKLIEISAKENDYTIVTVYPNKIQLFPGSRYKHNLMDDVKLAIKHGATHVISSNDDEMFSEHYTTFIDQLQLHKQLNSSIFDFAARGQVTGAIRWISFVRPTRSYFGMKDIEQSLLVERAVSDLLIDCEIRHVPCIRYANGVPISSRLIGMSTEELEEVAEVYRTLELGRSLILSGIFSTSEVNKRMNEYLESKLDTFKILYVTIVDFHTFLPVETIDVPFIIHIAISNGKVNHFDGFCIRNNKDLENSPNIIWI